MPASVLNLVRHGEPTAVFVSNLQARYPHAPVTARFLHSECDNRLSAAETHVVRNCFRVEDETFFLRSALQKAPALRGPGYLLYSFADIAPIDEEKFFQFAAGMAWKASAGKWKDGQRILETPRMGPYEEQFRRYLLGDGGRPANARLAIQVATEPAPWNIAVLPKKHRWEVGQGLKHIFYIPGITFAVFVGKTWPPELDALGKVPLFLQPLTDNEFLVGAGATRERMSARGRLRTELAQHRG